jgi:streptogramin lyase
VCGPPTLAPGEPIAIETEEDFDFDALGYAVFQQGNDLVGRTSDLEFTVVAPGVSTDAAGIQVLPDGDVVVASPDTGAIAQVDRDTGASWLLVGGLSGPNGVEVGPGGVVYFSEYTGGRVRWVDPATLDGGELLSGLDRPNGVAVTSDGRALVVTVAGPEHPAILRVDRDDGAVEELLAGPPGAQFDGVETDVCGNVYAVDHATGEVLIVPPEGGSAEVGATLDDPGEMQFSALKWGNGTPGWPRTTLYVSNRHRLFPLATEVEGTPDAL